jgi:hypothetical protein
MSIQPLDGQLSPSPLSAFAGIGDAGGSLSQAGAQGALSSDAISRMVPPWLAGTVSNPARTALFGPLPGLLQQLVQMLQQMMGGAYGQGCNPYGGSYGAPYGGSGGRARPLVPTATRVSSKTPAARAKAIRTCPSMGRSGTA